MPTWITEALSEVYDPCCREKGISVVDMGLLRSVSVVDGHARVELLLTSGWCPFASRVLADVEQVVASQTGIESCEVEIVWDEAWTSDRLSEAAVSILREQLTSLTVSEETPLKNQLVAKALGASHADIERALKTPGHAIAVVPLRPLLAQGGVLDQLRAKGFTVTTPGEE